MTAAENTLTTTEAARLAGVGTTSVKRWAEEGLLPCVRTAGGHRRFRRGDVEALINRSQADDAGDADGAAAKSAAVTWAEAFVAAPQKHLESLLFDARWRLGSWAAVCDDVGGGLAELGRRWATGRVTIAQEHAASERLRRALARAGDTLPDSGTAARCALISAEGDDHTLGLSLAELTLREAGWQPLWLGRRIPVDEVRAVLQDTAVRALAVSATRTVSAAALAEFAHAVEAAARDTDTRLILGGDGPWPEHLEFAERLRSFVGFSRLMRELGGSS